MPRPGRGNGDTLCREGAHVLFERGGSRRKMFCQFQRWVREPTDDDNGIAEFTTHMWGGRTIECDLNTGITISGIHAWYITRDDLNRMLEEYRYGERLPESLPESVATRRSKRDRPGLFHEGKPGVIYKRDKPRDGRHKKQEDESENHKPWWTREGRRPERLRIKRWGGEKPGSD